MASIYPFKKYNYDVSIDGKSVGGFSEVSAPDVTIDPIEYREGNFKANTAGKQPGLVKYGNVTLKWGTTAVTDLYNWAKEVEHGTINRKTVTISLLSDTGDELAKWSLTDAWPTKYTAPDFNATNNEVAIESLELVHEGLTREK
ncbi:phage tail protein [Butyricicoccus faecihominis]|uniref:phage tail protein n=1 Tax=Butyricicoccaceae TaxID=3085642 RepID=UPI0024798D29|nr:MULTISPECIES: phage tail protein [Butyricicoccaceae]MCQ5128643.1 phage tail protein [Butyricicoccus faecihominis]WNX85669.1 phage tail protein [Agathobaculum sp. NTUH-O15-33]